MLSEGQRHAHCSMVCVSVSRDSDSDSERASTCSTTAESHIVHCHGHGHSIFILARNMYWATTLDPGSPQRSVIFLKLCIGGGRRKEIK